MNQNDLRNLGPSGLFDALSLPMRKKILAAWRHIRGPEGIETDHEILAEVFCNASQLISGARIEIFKGNTPLDVNVEIPEGKVAQDLNPDELIALLISTYQLNAA